jgi:hypothetical protein
MAKKISILINTLLTHENKYIGGNRKIEMREKMA